MKISYTIAVVLAFAFGCSNSDDVAEKEYIDVPLDFSVPSNFPPLAYNLETNPITQKGFELGK